MEQRTTEQHAADTILQHKSRIQAGDKTYDVAPPSIATLILLSAEISRMPLLTLREQEDFMVLDVLHAAKDCTAIGLATATLILGAREINKTHTRTIEQRKEVSILGGIFHLHRTETIEQEYDPVKELGQELLENLSPADMLNTLKRLLAGMQIGDFFGISTFLNEVNLTKATKVEKT